MSRSVMNTSGKLAGTRFLSFIPVAFAAVLGSIALMCVSSVAAFFAISLLSYAVIGVESKRELMRKGAAFGMISSLLLMRGCCPSFLIM